MEFLVSIYGDDEVWGSISDDERTALIEATDAHNTALFESGEPVFACGTADPDAYRLVTTETRGLYALLRRVDPSPLVTLNAVVAAAEVNGVAAAFELLATIEGDARLAERATALEAPPR